MDKIRELLSQAKEKLAESNKAIEDGDMELANTLKEESKALREQASALKENLDAQKALDDLQPDDEPNPFQPPHDVGDDDPPSTEPAKAVTDPVHVLRYGEEDPAIKAVTKDLFGEDYNGKRLFQKRSFVKFIRFGEVRMSAKERASLDELIYTPEVIRNEVKSGMSVAEIKATKATQQESSLELGGALVPEDWRAEVLMRLAARTIVRQRARVITTVRDKVEWPKLLGGSSRHRSGMRVTWVDAEVPSDATQSRTNFTLGTNTVPVHTTMVRTDVSKNLLEDSGVDVLDLVADLFAEEMAVDEDDQFLTGTGGGRPEGVLGARSGAEQTPVVGVDTVNSGDASLITADGLIDLVYELDVQYLDGAVFVGAKQTFRNIRKIKDGNGDYLWARGLERGAPPVLLDFDFFMNEGMPAIAANAHPLIFGNWKGYLIADRVGFAMQRVEDVTSVGQNMVVLYGRRRLGGGVILPWMLNVQKIST